MDLVERHVIKKSHPAYREIDLYSFYSKNLFNSVLYATRQAFFNNRSPTGNWVYHEVKKLDEYKVLPRKVSKQVLIQVSEAWRSYFALVKAYASGKIDSRPKIPKYLDKGGRNVLRYDNQSFSRRYIKDSWFNPSGTSLFVPTGKKPKGGRIVPKKNGDYVVEIIYEKEPIDSSDWLDCTAIAGIDFGVDNIVALASDQVGFIPLVVNGRVIKSINQFYNKRKAEMQSRLPKGQYTSRAIAQLTDKRNRRIDHLLHTISRRIVDYLYDNRIGKLVIGRNKGWKDGMKIGRVNNQKFSSIPYYKLLHMLTYKAQLLGIEVIETEESYTSKCSFLDLEPLGKHDFYIGRRVKRGLFISSNGTRINADINAALNMIRKVFSIEEIEGISVSPVRVNFV